MEKPKITAKDIPVEITEEELPEWVETLKKHGVKCEVRSIRYEGGITIPIPIDSRNSTYLKAGRDVEVIVGIDPTDQGSSNKLEKINEVFTKFVQDQIIAELRSLNKIKITDT